MQVEVRVFATFREPVAKLLGIDTSDEIFIHLPENTKLIDLMKKLGLDKEKVFIALVNGVRQEADYQLSNGDRVGLFPPVGGG